MRRTLRYLLVFAGVLGLTALAGPALAYTPTPGHSGGGPSTVPGGQPFTFTVNGFTPGTTITFLQASGPAGCAASFNPTSTVADPTGAAATTVTLPAGCCPGTFVLVGVAPDGSNAQITVSETGCTGFPNTSANAPAHNAIPVWAMALAGFVLVALVLGSTTFLMRSRQRIG
jgi:hypothetical protein